MPELRKDPVSGRWVIIATERARRPGTVINHERISFTEIHADQISDDIQNDLLTLFENEENKKWAVRVLSVDEPLLNSNKDYVRRAQGLYDVVNGYGNHELVIESHDSVEHVADLEIEQLSKIVEAYRLRLKALEKDQNLKYAFIYKNFNGEKQRVSSHIIASPVIPLHIKEKLRGAMNYYSENGRCIFSDMIDQERETQERIIFENDHFIALTPFASRFPFEIILLPKKHDCDYVSGVDGLQQDCAEAIQNVYQKIKEGLENPPFTMVINTAPFRMNQSNVKTMKTLKKDFCWHIEIVPRLTRVAGFEKGTDFYICPIPPESTAEYLREVKI